MSIPTLADLALPQVIINIFAGFPTPSMRLNRDTSNKMFRRMIPFHHSFADEFYSTISNILNVSEVSLAGGSSMNEKVIPFVHSHKLTRLELGGFSGLTRYHTDKERRQDCKTYPMDPPGVVRARHRKKIQFFIDIHALLRDMLNEESRKALVHLDLSPEPSNNRSTGRDEQFIDNWVSQIAPLLPSLQSLSIRLRFTTPSEFRALCERFQNLQILDLTNTDIESLCGISQLKELQTLRIGGLLLKQDDSFDEIFELTNLRNLSFEASSNCGCCCHGKTINLYLASGKSVPSVHLDFSQTATTVRDESVATLVRAHPNLKSISICGTHLTAVNKPGIKVFHCSTFSGAIEALQFYVDMKNQWMVTAVMDNLKSTAFIASTEELESCLSIVNSAMEAYSYIQLMSDCGCKFYERLMNSHSLNIFREEDKEKMFKILLNDITRRTSVPGDMHEHCREFDVLDKRALLREVSFLDVQLICRGALMSMQKLTGRQGAISHVLVLDILKDRMDPTSKTFEGVEKQKVSEYLERERDRGVWRDEREMIISVEEFVNANF